ncbi:MAG: hypothetical protein ACI9HI_002472, partial [Salinirussus sp.]
CHISEYECIYLNLLRQISSVILGAVPGRQEGP